MCEQVLIDRLGLPGMFDLVAPAEGRVVFAHGSSSDHLSRRNRHLAVVLQQHRRSTLMSDLLTPAEATDRHKLGLGARMGSWGGQSPGSPGCRTTARCWLCDGLLSVPTLQTRLTLLRADATG